MKPYSNYQITEQTPLRVVTYWWSDPVAKHKGHYEYEADHVYKLHSMWKRNCSYPFTFHVITDQVDLFKDNEEIDAIDIARWAHVIKRFGRCYVKLSIFGWWARECFGPTKIITLDLDTVITGSVDGLVKKGEDTAFIGCRATHSDHGSTRIYSGALHMHSAGEFRNIWDTFNLVWKLKAHGSDMTGSDQTFFTSVLGEDRWPSWDWNKDGIYDYKSVNGQLPEGACVMFMSGLDLDMSKDSVQEQSPWVKEHWL